jgi:serine/threonine protein phosphatase PrpC
MEWLVSAIPEIKEESLQAGADEFFIVASDGFWDVFSNENAVLLTRELMQKKELSLADVAQTLTAKAFSRYPPQFFFPPHLKLRLDPLIARCSVSF